jgi:sugar-specific transcriptional regulator TrmB
MVTTLQEGNRDLVEALGRLGFTKYEGEAYVALLRLAPITGYELGKRSGVPLSKCYVTLQRLVEKGAAVVEQSDPPRYAPVPPSSLVASRKSAILSDLDLLLRAAGRYSMDPAKGRIWCVIGRTNVLAAAREIVRESRVQIMAEVGPRDLEDLSRAFDQARLQVPTRVIDAAAHGAAAVNPSRVLLLSDDRKILAGTTFPEEDCRAISTTNPALVALGLSFFRSLDAVVSMPALRSGRRIAPGSWLAWEDRKHQNLVGRLN